MKRSAPKSDPEKVRVFVDRGRRSSAESLRRTDRPSKANAGSVRRQKSGFTPASKAQRAKVKGSRTVLVADVFGRVYAVLGPITSEHTDPMHLTPRSKGGCDHADCIVAAARESVHGPYDDGSLDLLTFFAEQVNRLAYLPELQHMLTHLNPVEMVEQLANARVEWREAAA